MACPGCNFLSQAAIPLSVRRMDATGINIAIWLLAVQSCLGAFDTLYYHEYRLRLPHQVHAGLELRLHAARDFAYTIIIGSLGWLTWNGWWTPVLGLLLVVEIIITLWDFIEEDKVRKLPPGERAGHAIMGIVYGAFLAYLIPEMWRWFHQPTGFTPKTHGFPSWVLTIVAAGVCISGIRDMIAAVRKNSTGVQ
jgi:hypothetical protein